MKLINLTMIKKLRPCEDRLKNYVKHYGDRKLRKTQFMGLKNITQEDKMWVAFRCMPKENAVKAVADIAESVLSVYESKYPLDNRPRKAIEAARTYGNNPTEENREAIYAAIYAANAAAKAAYATAAYYAAYYAANAAYYAANAAYAATYVAYAAYYAADAYAAGRDRKAQEKLIRKIVLRYWR